MKNKIFAGIFFLSVLLFVGVLIYGRPAEPVNAGALIRGVDVIGTGTSTSGTANFGAAAATSTSSFVVGGGIDIIDFEIYQESASSTAHVGLQILKSSVDRCIDSGNKDWVDALPVVSSNVITSGTTTVQWVPSGNGTSYQLTNVNANCYRLDVGGQSVNLYIKANLKTLSF